MYGLRLNRFRIDHHQPSILATKQRLVVHCRLLTMMSEGMGHLEKSPRLGDARRYYAGVWQTSRQLSMEVKVGRRTLRIITRISHVQSGWLKSQTMN
jgi:hypothetical protein